jgi:hypothetical protein
VRAADGAAVLRERVAELDAVLDDYAGDDPGAPETLAGYVEGFISVLDLVTVAADHFDTPVVSAPDADAAVASSRLIGQLGRAAPPLDAGPIAGYPQYWIATSKPDWLPQADLDLAPERFVPVPAWAGEPFQARQFGCGLYTATGFRGTQGMWRAYLDLGHYSSNYEYPWHAWRAEVSPDARVFDVTTAARWEELLLRYPWASGGLVFPDWHAMARDWDGVHLTVRAVAAIQGLRIQTAAGLLVPSYWDTETTFWLRWSFTAAHLVEIAAAPGEDSRSS